MLIASTRRNISYLTGFDPRFEEALMVVTPSRTPVLFAGPENRGFAATARIDLSVVLYPPFGLMGQDRSQTRPLADLLREAGLAAGIKVGIVGWKYYGAAESRLARGHGPKHRRSSSTRCAASSALPAA